MRHCGLNQRAPALSRKGIHAGAQCARLEDVQHDSIVTGMSEKQWGLLFRPACIPYRPGCCAPARCRSAKPNPPRPTPSSRRFAAILKLLRNPRGATVSEIAKARGRQPHTVRSVLSRLGSKAGLVLTRTKVEGRGGLGIASGEKQVLRSRAELSFSCPSLRARV
jgi:DNA-binding NarL/FixJ family response regulator